MGSHAQGEIFMQTNHYMFSDRENTANYIQDVLHIVVIKTQWPNFYSQLSGYFEKTRLGLAAATETRFSVNCSILAPSNDVIRFEKIIMVRMPNLIESLILPFWSGKMVSNVTCRIWILAILMIWANSFMLYCQGVGNVYCQTNKVRQHLSSVRYWTL